MHVPATAVDELLQELHYSLTSASNQGTCCIISDILRNHNLEVGESVIQELSEAVGRSNPLVKAIEKGGHFHVTRGYPPDIVHDLFEGIVPFELARCLKEFVSKKYLSLDTLNTLILNFPYKWGDKTNKPHSIPYTYASKKSIGGNAHENWNLLRLLPLIIGDLIPENEPAWLVLLDLKEIVELAVAPIHNEETIAYLNCKIVEHRHRFVELFPAQLLPNYVEHYPQMIQCFGPLVGQWTMRSEAKHSFFKKVARHTNCFKNLMLTLAAKHQQMIAYQIHSCSLKKSTLEVTSVSTLPVDVLNKDVVTVLRQKYPGINEVHLAKNVTNNGINYRTGMLISFGSAGGLPEFAEILQICIVKSSLHFVVKVLCVHGIKNILELFS